MTTTLPRRLGAAALAAATIAAGLGFAAPAAASPTPTGTPPVTSPDTEVTRLVGPLALIESADTAYGLSMDPDALRTRSATTVTQALADSDFLSVPAPGQVGPVTGVGEKADRCLTWGWGTQLGASTCTGAEDQDFTWTTVPTLQGASEALTPADDSGRAIRSRGAGTFTRLSSGDERRPLVISSLAETRTLTADAVVNWATKTVTITGVATSGATVSAPGATSITADTTTGAYTLTVSGLATGDNTITVTQTLPDGTPYGTLDVTVTLDEVTRVVGPLALLNDADTAYGLSLDADTLRTKTAKPVTEAVADGDYFSVPTVGTSGPIHGVGAKADRCLVHGSKQNISVAACSGGANQAWTWRTISTVQGFNLTLTPSDKSWGLRPRGAGTWVANTTANLRPVTHTSLAGSRTLTADASVDAASKTATITGVATSGATISAPGATSTTADATTGAYTLTVPALPVGDNTITVTQTLPNGTPYGTLDVTATVDATYGGLIPRVFETTTLTTGETTSVPVYFSNPAGPNQRGDVDMTLTATAPAGTTFTEGQTAVPMAHTSSLSLPWTNHPQMDLQNGTLSEDKKTLTFTVQASDINLDQGTYFRYLLSVTADTDATPGDATMSWALDNTAANNQFRLAGTSPVTIDEAPAPTEFAVTNPNAEQIAAGYTPNTSYTFEGTGTSGSTVTPQNARGVELGPAVPVIDGTWTWTRTNMGTYNWIIDFVQDKGLPGEQTQHVKNFKPAEPEVPVPGVFAVTNPTPEQIAAGYTPNTSYTFEGTGTSGSMVTPQNARGVELGPAVPVVDGTWTWTRTNMGSYDWIIDFVQDKGLEGELKQRIGVFKPIQPEVPAPATFAVTNPNAEQIAAGYTPNTSYTFEGTGTSGSTVTPQNARGVELGPAVPVVDGTWTWTRTNMGTYNWIIDFVQDKGLPGEDTQRISNFKPAS